MENAANPDLKSMLSYDPLTGGLTWVGHRLPHMNGKAITRKDRYGYLVVRYGKKEFRAHRVVWLLCKGYWPEQAIDHMNGDHSDNRIENLRDVSLSVNQQNRKGRSASTKYDCPMGVTFYRSRPTTKPWIAKIVVNKKAKLLGYFSTKEAAGAAYLMAKRELHEGNLI